MSPATIIPDLDSDANEIQLRYILDDNSHIVISRRKTACDFRPTFKSKAPVAGCGEATKPGLAPNGTHFDCDSSDSLDLLGFLRF